MPDWNVRSFQDLVGNLRNWGSFGDSEVYDCNGMLMLLGACVDNLIEYADDYQLRTFGNTLDVEQLLFLERLVGLAREGENEE
jgi:hypothetical protein